MLELAISNIKKMGILVSFFLLFLIGGAWPANADWTPPPTSPFFCPTNDPACQVPINASSSAQIKTGALGILNTLTAFSNFFTNKSGLGPNYVNGTYSGGSIPSLAVLDLAGQISIRGGLPAANKVLISDVNGLASWGDDLWRKVGVTNDIENTNSGTVYFNNALAKGGSSLLGGNRGTQINLGVTSTTGGVPDVAGATVGGGQTNQAAGGFSVIRGGRQNVASSSASVLGGGSYINNLAAYGVVLGGTGANASSPTVNSLTATHSAIGGGYYQGITGSFSVIPGGNSNQSTSNYSFVGGRNAHLGSGSTGVFLWENNSSAQGAVSPAPPQNSFLIFPRNAAGKLSIATTSTTHTLNVEGQAKISSAVAPALEINGQIKITGGASEVGRILTTAASDGLATWTNPDRPGASVMYLRSRSDGICGGNIPTQTIAGWNRVGNGQFEDTGGFSNYIYTFWRDDTACQVIYLRQRVASCVNPTASDPPACPSGFTEADLKTERAIGNTNGNRVRTCYLCQ